MQRRVQLCRQLVGEFAQQAQHALAMLVDGQAEAEPELYTTDANGRGPAWANSLFEDNAEFGLGFRLTVDQHRQRVLRLLSEFASRPPKPIS